MNAGLRYLFTRLLHREIDADGWAMAQNFLQTALGIPPFAKGGQGGFCSADHLPPDISQTQLATVLRLYAPSALLQWDWLRRISHAGASHQAVNAALFAAYLDAAGLHDPAPSLAAQYRALSIQAGLQLPALNRLADDSNLPQATLTMPCTALALSHFPMTRLGEIIGYTLAHCRQGGVWLDWLERQLQNHGLAGGYCRRHRELLEKHQARLLIYRDLPGSDVGDALYQYGQQDFISVLNQELSAPLCPDQLAEAMLRRKLPYALGHHGRIKLQDIPLDQWLAQGDLHALKQALRQLPAIIDRLLESTAFGGVMFGVFSAEEQALLRAWLEDGARASCPPGRSNKPGWQNPPSKDTPNAAKMAAAPEAGKIPALPTRRAERSNTRELYHQLLNHESHPDCLPNAAHYAETILGRTRLLAPLQLGLKRRFAYSPEAFKQRVDAIYRKEMNRYRPLSGPPKLPRELYLWGIAQMAPAILLDGCWLENLAGAEPVQDDVQRRLLQTFADEVGDGKLAQNHPHVYRRLLQGLDINLPPEISREFAQHPQLHDAAFVLPTYLLAIGLNPERFFPEILGLNLAIELSGLGASYMQLIDNLRYYGIDPGIIQLHLSIDNLACGHAALAREAIEIHLEQLQSLAGCAALTPAWRRIWTGYLSLNNAMLPFVWAGLRQYGRHKSKRSGSP